MKEPFFAKSPPKVPSGSQQDGKEYTYFDSIVSPSRFRQEDIWKESEKTK